MRVRRFEVTTTAGIPIYFPGKRHDDDPDDQEPQEEMAMSKMTVALGLVEMQGVRARTAINFVVEADDDAIKQVAKEMAAGIEDPAKRKEAEDDFVDKLTKKAEQLKKEADKQNDEDDDDSDKDKDKEEDDDDPEKDKKKESRKRK